MDPEINWRAWQFWFGVGQYIIGIIVAVFVWASNRDKARSEDIAAIKNEFQAEIKAVDERVAKVENSQCTTEDLGKVYDRLNEMSDKVSVLLGTNKGIERTVDIIQEFLMKQGGKQ